nr:MAG TPA: hypothetical protein [Caudoviricetes sp.]
MIHMEFNSLVLMLAGILSIREANLVNTAIRIPFSYKIFTHQSF